MQSPGSLKEDDPIELLADHGHEKTIIVSSFDRAFLKRFGAKAPAYRTGLQIK